MNSSNLRSSGFSDLNLPTSPDEFEVPSAATELADLVYMRRALSCQTTMEMARKLCSEWEATFVPVLGDAGEVLGLCSQSCLGERLGSRFGFALFANAMVLEAMVPHPLIFDQHTPVTQVIRAAMARNGREFHEDVIILNTYGRLLGLVRTETLAQLQNKIMAEQLGMMQRQKESLHASNLDLFRANNALRQSQGQYLGVLENHVLAVALIDTRGVIQKHNRRLAELLKLLPGATAEGMSVLSMLEGGDRERFFAMLQTLAQGQTGSPTIELTFQIEKMGLRQFRCSVGWIPETAQFCLCLDDITVKRAMEREVAARDKQVLLETLVGGIAHELNNKMTPVLGFSEMLERMVPQELKSYFKMITDSVEEASTIIKQLRELAHPQLVEVETVDMDALVEDSLKLLKFKFRDCGCELIKQFSGESHHVMANPGQIKQVLMNLVINALHAMRHSSHARLTVALGTFEDMVELRITDNGEGIADENIDRIFDPFFTTKAPNEGTGLGLSICRSIVRQFSGTLSVKSTLGEGATFVVCLPRAEEIGLIDSTGERTSLMGKNFVQHGRVLVVDDEEILRLMLQSLFHVEMGICVDQAANGAVALAMLEHSRYDLILCDIRMPVMGGLEFYEHLRKLSPTQAARVVFITGHPGFDGEEKLREWGAPVVHKPFSYQDLKDVCLPFISCESPATQAG